MDQIPIPNGLLTQRLQQTFGSQASLTGWTALTGGARKKVLRLELDRPRTTVVLLAWQNEQDYFGERENAESTRSDRTAPLLYRANTECLLRHGVKVPAIYDFDDTYRDVPFCFALVEYLQGRTFNEWNQDRSAPEIQAVFANIRDYLHRMHSIRRGVYGTLLDESPKPESCHERVLKETYSQLSGLASDFPLVGQNEDRVRAKLDSLYSRIPPRNQYSLIHDELGPDEHLLIGEKGDIAIIDVDGCQFWDLEREFAYLKLRFAENYARLERNDLDDARMRFYGLCLNISAAYGHYQLYKKGFPDPDMLKAIYEWNIHQTLCVTEEG